MEPDEIYDKKSLDGWLSGRPLTDGITISQRTVLRVFPLFGAPNRDLKREDGLTVLVVLRQLFTSGVARVNRTAEVIYTTGLATVATARVLPSTAYAAREVARAASSGSRGNPDKGDAASSQFGSPRQMSATAIESAVDAFEFFGFANLIWDQIREDARMLVQDEDPFTARLWSIPAPQLFSQFDAQMRAIWAKDPPGTWHFWLQIGRAHV